jgi:DnaJ-class molecular chaperone
MNAEVVPNMQELECPVCYGEKYTTRDCPKCGGDGCGRCKYRGEIYDCCEECGGTGEIITDEDKED